MAEQIEQAARTAGRTFNISLAELDGANAGQRNDLLALNQAVYRVPDGTLYTSDGSQLVPAQGLPVMASKTLTGGIELTAGGEAVSGLPMNVYSSFVPFVLTGSTTETLMAQIPIPDGAMGPNSKLVIEVAWEWTNTANNKTMRVKIGNDGPGAASDLYSRTRSVNRSEIILFALANRGVTNSQIQFIPGNYAPNSNNALFTNTLDFSTTGCNVYLTGLLSNASDSLTVGGATVTIFNPRK